MELMERKWPVLVWLSAAIFAITAYAHDTGSPPYTGYSGPDIESACTNFEVDTDGTLKAICHSPVTVVGVPYDQNNGQVEHIQDTNGIELGDKIKFASGDLSYDTSTGDFDDLCTNISISATSTAVNLTADCDDDPNDSTAATSESLDISNNIVVHSSGSLGWYTPPATN